LRPTPKGYARLPCTCSCRSPSRCRHSHALARRHRRRLLPPSHERPVGGHRSSLLSDAPARREWLLRPCLAQRWTSIVYEFAFDDIPLSDFTSPRRITLAVVRRRRHRPAIALPPPRPWKVCNHFSKLVNSPLISRVKSLDLRTRKGWKALSLSG